MWQDELGSSQSGCMQLRVSMIPGTPLVSVIDILVYHLSTKEAQILNNL